jgi:hypothetical protein
MLELVSRPAGQIDGVTLERRRGLSDVLAERFRFELGLTVSDRHLTRCDQHAEGRRISTELVSLGQHHREAATDVDRGVERSRILGLGKDGKSGRGEGIDATGLEQNPLDLLSNLLCAGFRVVRPDMDDGRGRPDMEVAGEVLRWLIHVGSL